MKFIPNLLTGTFIKRYKRFFVDIKYKNKEITAHCPNPGSMMGLLDKGNQVWISKSKNPERKLKYTLEIIKIKNDLVGVNTQLTNKIVFEALNGNKISEFINLNKIKAESVFDKETRFDFLILKNKKRHFLEVKNVTLVRKNNIAEFPDAITNRGTKHLLKLIEAKQGGFESSMLYLIQRENCNTFKIAEDIDKNYKIAFDKAKKSGVKILCYDCHINHEEVILNRKIKLI